MIHPPESVLTVSELTRSIKNLLEENFYSVTVTGEISNFHRHSSGHLYFTLKDTHSQMSAVLFRGNSMSMFFRPQNGMEVICRGNITVYEPRGAYQLMVTDMQPRGEGALQAAFERLKQKLFKEGLFDESRKKQLPKYPKRIALVTSPTGAALRDMLSVIRRRNPMVELVLVPVQVQGVGAYSDIAGALDLCNEYGDIDVIIISRGGGSIEDLWAFNEEEVARAIARSGIPVVSAVGHEVDYTIADFAADLRAATPSVAGEIVVPSLEEMKRTLKDISYTVWKYVNLLIGRNTYELRSVLLSKAFHRPTTKILRLIQLLDEKTDLLNKTVDQYMERIKYSVNLLQHRHRGHDPERIIKKGFVIARKGERIVHSIQDVKVMDMISLELHDGRLLSMIEEKQQKCPPKRIR